MDAQTTDALQRVLALTAPGFGRDADYHERQGFYARQFARGQGRALVGYSESLYYLLMETAHSCRHSEGCLRVDQHVSDIGVKAWPLSDNGALPMSWVDLLVVDASVRGQKLQDAAAFIAYVTRVATYQEALIPEGGEAPRYLLPARRELYTDPHLVDHAPLYPLFQPLIEQAAVVV